MSAMDRRGFLKAAAAAATASAAGLTLPEELAALADPETGWRWDRGQCRFCGVDAASRSPPRGTEWSRSRAIPTVK